MARATSLLAVRQRSLVAAVAPAGLAWQAIAVVAGSALVALTAQIQIPLPFSPVPVTGQTFGVLLVAASLGARLGPASVGLYVLEGAVGLPVYAGGAAGLARLGGPTGGYLVGFVAAAAVIGALARRGWDRRLPTAFLAMLAGEVAIYVFGLAWLSRFPLQVGLLEAGLLPFIPGDLYKAALAALALPAAWRLVPSTTR